MNNTGSPLKRASNLIKGLITAMLIGLASPAIAAPEVNITPGGVLVDGKPGPGLAVHGYDPVAYFKQGKPVIGNPDYAFIYQKASYRFSSKANLETFKSNPAKYAPVYGGYCAYGVSVGAKFDGSPQHWKIVDGKLYLNLDKKIADAFNKDVKGAIKKADTNWVDLKSK